MFQIVFIIWYLIAILPFLIFLEASKKFSNFLKKKNIYLHWDLLHSYLVALIILLIILWLAGFR